MILARRRRESTTFRRNMLMYDNSLEYFFFLTILVVAVVTNAFVVPSRSFLSSSRAFLRTPVLSHHSSLSLRSTAQDQFDNDDHHCPPTVPVEWQGEILRVLKAVVDPDLHQDIVTLGFVQNLQLDPDRRHLTLELQLTTPACPVKDQFQSDCTRLILENLAWIHTVDITMTSQSYNNMDSTDAGMSNIGAVIAVSSCKGGVGKSTTSVNLAFALQSLGARVGIFDADVYGPSLPTMIKPDDDMVRFVGRQIAPLQRNGVQLMSFGYVNEGSAVMRGPMVTQLLDQFLNLVHWGTLDYLILDMPPGTGDIQLTLTQRLNISAAVIVTTPQELSFADVVRGVEMFDTVNVPCIAVVENMAYYQLPPVQAKQQQQQQQLAIDSNQLESELVQQLLQKEWLATAAATLEDEPLIGANGGKANGQQHQERTKINDLARDLVQVVLQHVQQQRKQQEDLDQSSSSQPEAIRIFGPGHKRRLAEQWGIDHTFSLPLLEQIATNGDSGTPYLLEHPQSPAANIYRDLAKAVVTEVAKIKFTAASSAPLMKYLDAEHVLQVNDDDDDDANTDNNIEATDTKASTSTLSPAELRRACRCAACVEEMTGRQLLVAAAIPESIKPMRMKPCGNYAWSVDWSDGHRSLYPYRQIQALVQASKKEKQKQQQQQQQQFIQKVEDKILT